MPPNKDEDNLTFKHTRFPNSYRVHIQHPSGWQQIYDIDLKDLLLKIKEFPKGLPEREYEKQEL
jgi:hypothetical protein